ncbi:MAG: DNA polymerase III subunit delta [Gammaproteobacteria bacterium]
MQLTVERLMERLRAQSLAPVYFFHGDEPLQLLECADAVRARALEDGINERCVYDADTGIDWQALAEEGNALSLFATRRLFEIRLGERKPDKGGPEFLERLASQGLAEDVVVVTAGKPDKSARNARWFKALEADAVCVATRDLRGAALPEWLARRAARFGRRLERGAAALVAERVEGNMLAAAQEVEKLALLVDTETITEDDVLAAVRDSARYDVFQFADAVLAGDLARALRMVRGLREEGTEALLLNWALGRELRSLVAMAAAIERGKPLNAVLDEYRVWQGRKAAIRRVLERCSKDDLMELLAYANFIDTVVKGGRSGDPWDEIEILSMKLSGAAAADGLLRRL